MSHRRMPVTRQRRAERRNQAMQRQAAYDELTTQEKLDKLPATGATRQRERLTAQLAKESSGAVTTQTTSTETGEVTLRKTKSKERKRPPKKDKAESE